MSQEPIKTVGTLKDLLKCIPEQLHDLTLLIHGTMIGSFILGTVTVHTEDGKSLTGLAVMSKDTNVEFPLIAIATEEEHWIVAANKSAGERQPKALTSLMSEVSISEVRDLVYSLITHERPS